MTDQDEQQNDISIEQDVTKRESRSKRMTASKTIAHFRDNLSAKKQGKKRSFLKLIKEKFISSEKSDDDEHERVVFIDHYSHQSRLMLYHNKEKVESLAHL